MPKIMGDEGAAEIQSFTENGIHKIILNRPKKKNALTFLMYADLSKILYEASQNDSVYMVVMTGAGSFFSSGNDIAFALNANSDPSAEYIDPIIGYKTFVDDLINYPKLLIAVVNGPAIGIAATMLPLFDIVYASDKAYFQTPFTKLGLTAEGCSTYTFPKIMGNSKAGEMLYLGHKMNAVEAKQFGLVSEVYEHDRLDEVWSDLNMVSELSLESLLAIKNLVKKWNKEVLLQINEVEADTLRKRLESPDVIERFFKFMSRKSKM